MSYAKILATVALVLSAVSAQASTTYISTPNGLGISTLGVPNTTTYGQLFTVPLGGETSLQSFSLFIRGSLSKAYGGVATWTGTGAGAELFASSAFNAAFGSYTEVTVNTGGLNLVAGQLYVAYFSSYGIADNFGGDSMEYGNGSAVTNGIAWDNAYGGSPNHDNWNGCQGCTDRGYFAGSLTFGEAAASVPEPGSLTLLGLGIAGLAGVRRRKAA